MLTDDQRARCAVMCGWRKGSFSSMHPLSKPPSIETMPEEWGKLMERAMDAQWEFGKEGGGFFARPAERALHRPTIWADTIGECVCLAALAMDKETRDE